LTLHAGNEPNGRCPVCHIPVVALPDGTVPWHNDFDINHVPVLCGGWTQHLKTDPLEESPRLRQQARRGKKEY
jgi:hypothetical protein